MKRGNSTSFLIVALACLGAFAVYHQSASSGHHSARPADMTPSQDAGSRAENGTSQNETSPGSVISGAAAATKVDGIEPSSSPAEAPGLSLKEVERMRKLAIAHSTPASQYISEMFDAASPRADIAATVLQRLIKRQARSGLVDRQREDAAQRNGAAAFQLFQSPRILTGKVRAFPVRNTSRRALYESLPKLGGHPRLAGIRAGDAKVAFIAGGPIDQSRDNPLHDP